MKLGMQVGPLGHIALDGDPCSSPRERGTAELLELTSCYNFGLKLIIPCICCAAASFVNKSFIM